MRTQSCDSLGLSRFNIRSTFYIAPGCQKKSFQISFLAEKLKFLGFIVSDPRTAFFTIDFVPTFLRLYTTCNLPNVRNS